ncbi:NADH-quinone oxidoreductase subunit NuoG [Alphaproteobacteria bacterium]|nr:NADH-quinone oxidoreductase subunit NuoG [Alphaproteobacteria bacterium]
MTIGRFQIHINEKKVLCLSGQTVLDVCHQEGIEIPHLCYHPGVPTKEQCHVCLVMVKGIENLVASCLLPVEEDMEIITHTPEIDLARKKILNLLVSDHPLECPSCVRAGECDLQDLTFLYGDIYPDVRRKKKRPLKKFNSFVQGNMARCIGCQRCISFLENISGTAELGLFKEGKDYVVDTFLDGRITSKLSGNLVDLCPSGALTEKPSVLLPRPWEVEMAASIDVMDAMGSSIQLDCREEKVLRIQPLEKKEINQYWITDKIRFSYDGLLHQRLDQPYVRKDGVLEPCSWVDAFKTLVKKMSDLNPSEMGFLVGDLVEVDSVYLLRKLLDDMKVYNRDCRIEGAFFPTENRGDYLFNTGFEGIEKSDACLIVGSDIRYEAPLLNVRLRDRYKNNAESLSVIGIEQDLTFPHTYLGSSLKILNEIAEGGHKFSQIFEAAHFPMIILGMMSLEGEDKEALYETSRFIAQKYNLIQDQWNGFNVLHRSAGRIGALEVGFLPTKEGEGVSGMMRMARGRQLKLLYLLGVDELPLNAFADTFVVYQGHHGDAGAEAADIILPGAAFSEKNGFYVNTEGRAQFAHQAVFPPGEAKEDWKIIRGLSEVLGHKLPYETYEDIYKDLKNTFPIFNQKGLTPSSLSDKIYENKEIKQEGTFQKRQDYYLTNPICRASPTMRKCSQKIKTSKKEDL